MVRLGAMIGILAALAAFSARADPPQRFTSAHLFDVAYATDPQISPDGQAIAYVRMSMDIETDRARSSIWLIDLSTGEEKPLARGAGSYAAPRWSPDGTRILYVAHNGGRIQLRAIDRSDRSVETVIRLPQLPAGARWSPDGSRIAFAMFTPTDPPRLGATLEKPEGARWASSFTYYDRLEFRSDGRGYLPPGAMQVYVVPAEGGRFRRLTMGPVAYFDPTWLDDENLLVTSEALNDAERNPQEAEIHRLEVSTGKLTQLTTRRGPDRAATPSPDGKRIAYLGWDEVETGPSPYRMTGVYVMDPDGSNPRPITARLDREPPNGSGRASLAWAPDGRGVYALVEDRGEVALIHVALNGRMEELARDVGGANFGRPYASGAFSVSQSGVIAYTQARPDRPAEVATIKRGESPVRRTDLNADSLGEVALASLEEIHVRSPYDGQTIEAWIAHPPGFDPDGSYPLVLEVHGGPYAMYGPTFSPEIQRYAAAGYVVVYANPRGSTGYGAAFAREIDQNFPGNDHDDLMGVVEAVARRPYVDDRRLFVTGGSGGGTLTAWMIGKTDRFAAAAVVKPVINWTSWVLASDASAFAKRYWMGDKAPWEDPDGYWRRSPLSLVGNVNTPTLVMVGDEDWRTPAWEAEQYYTALKLKGVEAMLARAPGAAHAIAARPSQLAGKVDSILAWFARHDPVLLAERGEHAAEVMPIK